MKVFVLKDKFLILASLAILSGCGSSNESTNSNSRASAAPVANSEDNSDPTPTDPKKLSYSFRSGRPNPPCKTGRKTAPTLTEYCTLLMDEAENHLCEQASRKQLFDARCAPAGYAWAPVHEDEERLRESKKHGKNLAKDEPKKDEKSEEKKTETPIKISPDSPAKLPVVAKPTASPSKSDNDDDDDNDDESEDVGSLGYEN